MSTDQKTKLAHSNILLIRHAEKPDSGPDLSPAGQARAQAYVDYFKNYTLAGTDPGVPVRLTHLVAAADSSESERPVQTIASLALSLGLPVNSRFKDKDYEDLAAHLKDEAKFANSDILICWHHEHLLPLARALGVDADALPASSAWPDRWPGDVFGWLLQIRYDHEGLVKPGRTVCINQRLTDDDRRSPPGDPPPGDPPTA
jgi:hypothetical protein